MTAFRPLVALLLLAGVLSAEEPRVEQIIDREIDAKLTAENISAAPVAADTAILRRTMLDLVGRIPTAAEARAYAEDGNPDKRVALVERLLDSPAFARHQAAEFNTLLMSGTNSDLRDYLKTAFEEKRSWKQMFREMIVGVDNDPEQKGPLKFVRARVSDLDKLTNDAAVIFFGVNVSCAKCHDHPLVPDWTQGHYFGMTSFFNRSFSHENFVGEKGYGVVEYKTVAGEAKKAQLMFLTGRTLDEPENVEPDDAAKKEEKKQLEELKKNKQPPPPPTFSRRAKLVEALDAEDATRMFANAAVNWQWRRFFGRGLVHPADQMHTGSTASHPALLTELGNDFSAHNYDLRRLIRGIVLSQAYARSSRWESGPPPKEELFAVGSIRPLSPAQYGTLLKFAAANPDDWKPDLAAEQFAKKVEQMESAGRGLGGNFELPGDDFQVSVDEALFFSNSDRVLKELLPANDGTIVGKLKKAENANAAIDLATWNVFNRPANDEERRALTEFLHRREGRADDAYQQLLWALVTSGECRFNH